MPRGISDIPTLRIEVLQNFVTKWTADPNLVLSAIFGSSDSPSSTIKWESQEGGRGMSPFKPPGAPTPMTSPQGVAQHSAEAAFWGDKAYYDEEFLNNLRKEGTDNVFLGAEERLSKDLAGYMNRVDRRREWLFAKMLLSGSVSYLAQSGVKISVNYAIPSDHQVTLATARKWQSGSSRDILSDIIDGKKKISDDAGSKTTNAICNSTVLKYMAQDQSILTLLSKSTFGQGDLFQTNLDKIVGVNPKIIGSLLDIPNLIIYDEMYEVRAYLTAVVTATSTSVVSVDDVTDFEVGGTLRFYDVSEGTWEEETIASVQVEAGTVTVNTAPSTSYKAVEDYVVMRRPYVSDTQFVMWASTVDGKAIAEYKRAPYGYPERVYGARADRKEQWDPDGVFVRVQDKGLPVLYQRDAIYQLTVN